MVFRKKEIKKTFFFAGSMAERSNFKAVMLFTTFNVLIYAVPAHWMWSETGWLRSLGARDIAGAGMVHMLGGFSGLIGSYFVGNT